MDVSAKGMSGRLAWESSSWTSVELRTSQVYEHFGAEKDFGGNFKSIDHTWIESADGHRLFIFRASLINKALRRYEGYDDGAKCTLIEFDPRDPDRQHYISIQKQFASPRAPELVVGRPEPLAYFVVDGKPLHEAILKGADKGTAAFRNFNCRVFSVPAHGDARFQRDQLVYLERDSAIPVKIETFTTNKEDGSRLLASSWEADGIEVVDGYHMVKSSSMSDYMLDWKSHSTDLRLVKRIEVRDVHFNRKLQPSQFSPPPFQKSVLISNTINNTTRWSSPRTGKSTNKATTPASSSPDTVSGTAAMQAVPARAWTSFAPSAFMGIGGVLLATAILAKVYRRS